MATPRSGLRRGGETARAVVRPKAEASAPEGFLDVSGILAPKSIAVIGASERPGNLGGDTVRRLVKFRFPGQVFPINRSRGTVAGLPCHPSLAELPEAPDLAILAIPADGLLDAIRECAAAGVRHGIAYAGGLAEAGGEGVERQRALAALCRETGFLLCGPNCVGVINTALPATSTFATALHEVDELRPGVVSMVSQSGGIGTTSFSMAQRAGFGFRHLISSGNEAVVDFADYLHALAQDDGTKVIVAYLEGVQDGPKLVRALEEARRQRKPVVLIKAGRSPTTARAAQAHTGALVGEERVWDVVLQELSVIRVDSVEELIDVALSLVGNHGRLPAGPGVGIISFGGGSGVLAADQCRQHGLATPALSAEGAARLRPLLVSVASAANPLDLTPATAFRPEALARLPEALDVIAAEPAVDALLFIVSSLAARAAEITDVIGNLSQRSTKPVCIVWSSPPTGVVEGLATHGVYTFVEPERGLRALRRLTAHGLATRRPQRPVPVGLGTFDWSALVPERSTGVVPEHRCHTILRAAGLPVAAGTFVRDVSDLPRALATVGLPVVMKGISERVTHRAAAGLLMLDLRSEEEALEAFRGLEARARDIPVEFEGVYVQRMHKGGVEVLVSAFRDPLFGTMVSCGSGGGLTELIDDVVTERAPVGSALAADMLERLRIRRRARDARGPLASDAAAAFIVRFSELAATAPWLRFVLEVNPIKWSREGVVAVDGLLIIEAI
jgi:acyl-CoA synthetase (NDP forming)